MAASAKTVSAHVGRANERLRCRRWARRAAEASGQASLATQFGFPLPASGRGLGGGVAGRGALAKTSPPSPLSEAERGSQIKTLPRFRQTPPPHASCDALPAAGRGSQSVVAAARVVQRSGLNVH